MSGSGRRKCKRVKTGKKNTSSRHLDQTVVYEAPDNRKKPQLTHLKRPDDALRQPGELNLKLTSSALCQQCELNLSRYLYSLLTINCARMVNYQAF